MVLRRVLRGGSEKGVSRRFLEGPFGEHDPLDVSPIQVKLEGAFSEGAFWVLPKMPSLDGRNRARVIAESLARVIAAIRITSVHWRSYLPPPPPPPKVWSS